MKLLLDWPCGERLVGDNEDTPVRETQQHLAAAHAALEYVRAEILFLARPTV